MVARIYAAWLCQPSRVNVADDDPTCYRGVRPPARLAPPWLLGIAMLRKVPGLTKLPRLESAWAGWRWHWDGRARHLGKRAGWALAPPEPAYARLGAPAVAVHCLVDWLGLGLGQTLRVPGEGRRAAAVPPPA